MESEDQTEELNNPVQEEQWLKILKVIITRYSLYYFDDFVVDSLRIKSKVKFLSAEE